jgi:RNA polymerase sigma factor (sigma-70 family)
MPRQAASLLLRHIRRLTGVRSTESATDGQLLERFALQQDEAAFDALVQRYGSLVLGLCRRVLRDEDDAEDAFQATFLVLAKKASAVRKQESVGSWLYGVAYRVSLEARTRAARRRVHERQASDMGFTSFTLDDDRDSAPSTEVDPAVEVAWRELRPVLDDELTRLPEKYRAPVLLCYLQGKTNEEAAAQLSWPAGTVKGRLSRARDLLRNRLMRRGVALSTGMVATLLADRALADVPARLSSAVTKSAALFASGKAGVGAAAPRVHNLAEGALKAMLLSRIKKIVPLTLLTLGLLGAGVGLAYRSLAAEPKDAPKDLPPLVRTAQSGPWSAPATWEGGKVPPAASRVQVRPGHSVVYDLKSEQVIRSIHVGGTLRFATDKDTRLDVGLIKIQPGDDPDENGFDCAAHVMEVPEGVARPALEVGMPDKPVDAKHTALIRLTMVDGLDKQSCPAIVCCGGRMDLHGAPLSHSWVKLGDTAKKGDTTVTLAEPVTGWRVGDRVLVTATSRAYKKGLQTEERLIHSAEGSKITLDRPLEQDHLGTGEYRGEVANLSRNVIVESADPKGERGHTMYHRSSAGSLSYTEFRHLGKEGVLGRYSLHYHLVGDTMRGSYVIGNSIWDSGNRWLTIHGTNYLVVRDNVGYKSLGHGYFMEDGTEVYNVLDRNLAIGARPTKRLPKQVLPFDDNGGAGFWWTNSLNTFTRNVAVENGNYGYRYEATSNKYFKLDLPVRQPDGTRQTVDVRTLPFVRFDDNEVHSNVGLYGFNLGEGVDRVGPDTKHPFIIRNMKIWDTHYGFRVQSPSVLVENMKIFKVSYGVYHPNYDNHVYRDLYIGQTNTEPFNRGHDDLSIQYGKLSVDGLTFDGCRSGGMPLIQISDDNPTGAAVTHMRNVKTINWTDNTKSKAIVNLGGGPRPQPKTEKGVPVYLHDWFGPGRHAKVVSTKSNEFKSEADKYHAEVPLTGDESRVTEVKDVEFPKLLDPVDDLPPTTVITSVTFPAAGKLLVRGYTADNGTVKRVLINGTEAKSLQPNFAQWEVELPVKAGAVKLTAHAEDMAGNVEKTPHVVTTTAR